MSNFKMDDYVPVNERIEKFLERYPDGSIQSDIVELTGSRVTVKAYAYRTPDDPRPGIGHSSLDIPGSTPFTRGSEVENAETSAWGRAIAALGFEVKRGLASAEEVRNKQPERVERPAQAGRRAHPQAATTPAPAASLRDELIETMRKHGLGPDDLERYSDEVGIPEGQKATDAQLRQIIALIEQPGQDSTAEVPATGAHPAPASPTMEDILAVTGGEEIPPRPNTPEYGALEPPQKASARAYWAKRDKEAAERPDAEQLKAAVA